MAKIIGLHGKKSSGKDTVANHLTTYFAANFRKVAFADPIREMLKAGFGWDASYFERPLKEQIIEGLDKSPRDFMQPLGTEWGRNMIHPDLWINTIAPRVQALIGSGMNVLISDVRFDNEAEWIRKQGGTVWHIDRGDDDSGDTHASEAGIAFNKSTDAYINNQETLGFLFLKVEDMAKRLLAEQEEELAAQRESYERLQRGFFNEDGSPLKEVADTVDVVL